MNPNPCALRNLNAITLAAQGSVPALAQSDSYSYGGVALGQSRGQIDKASINARLVPLAWPSTK